MQRSLNGIFLKDGRIIRSSCFGSFSTTAMRGNGRSYCGIGCHPEKLTASNLFAMPAPRSRSARLEAGIKLINEFTYLCAERYYKLMHDGFRAADPQALIFSDRLPIYYSQDAVRAMVPYVDVIASNYDLDGPDGWVAHYFFDGLAPSQASLFWFPNSSAPRWRTGAATKTRVTSLKYALRPRERWWFSRRFRISLARPYIVGTHWFQYYDEPKGGRADGEDYNMGLVDIYDQPYQEVVATFQRTNSLLPGFTRRLISLGPA